MARNIGADGSTVYRAAITFTSRTGSTWTEHEGPYPKVGTARGRITFWARWMKRSGGAAEGTVEQAHTVWARLGEAVDPIAAARAQGIREAAAEIEARQSRLDAEERAEFGHLDHETELQGAAVRDMATHLRRLADAIHPATEEPTP